ncbi:3-hydroxyacyl-ACP dehydratase FabZ [Devosia sp.]|uniref:3-hydroxyacyl-ACP dehydratase FabZ n=1 Tax=Devosia sp. TaxID=1871048 RepID=UPI0025DE0D4B|nr:3-hydroxyacyl-ACP dehydratase FabZ [Devosia sp.]MCR6636327.1 3-hydroxyacyl-ACP dehydratase FabZ [Devosia sp.]
MVELSAMEIGDLLKVMPHRFPMLMLDKIVSIDGDDSAIGVKCVSINEPWAQGHFPDQPIFPGVLIVEAIAQVAGAIALRGQADGEHVNSMLLLGVDQARFRSPAHPGDVLHFHLQKEQRRRQIGRYRGIAKVGDRVVAEAIITAMFVAN